MSAIETWKRSHRSKGESIRICREPDNESRMGWSGNYFQPQTQYRPDIVDEAEWEAIAKAVKHTKPKDCVWEMLEIWPNRTLEIAYIEMLARNSGFLDILALLDPAKFEPAFVKACGKSTFKFYRDSLTGFLQDEAKLENAARKRIVKAVKPSHFTEKGLADARSTMKGLGKFEFSTGKSVHVADFSRGVGMGSIAPDELRTKSEEKAHQKKLEAEYEAEERWQRQMEDAQWRQAMLEEECYA